MSAAAYRIAPPSARLARRFGIRTRRALWVGAVMLAIVIAIALVSFASVPLTIFVVFVALTYGAGFLAGVRGCRRGEALPLVTTCSLITPIVATALYADPDDSLWWVATAIALVAYGISAFVSAGFGFARATRPKAKPEQRMPIPRVSMRPACEAKKPAREREELPLDELPDSWRGVVFTVRLRRRLMDRSR